MVGRRSTPLLRRLRPYRGRIGLAAVWLAAALTTATLYLVDDPTGTTRGAAVVATRSVLAPESGRLARVQVRPGQVVEAGQILAVIEVPGLTQELAAADSAILAADEGRRFDDNDRARRYARDLDGMRADLLATRVALESERALLAGLEAELARLQAPGVAVPTTQVETARAQRDASRATVVAREAEVGVLERAVADAQARVAGAGGTGSAALLVAEAERDALRAREAALTLRAHVRGTVDRVFGTDGEWVQAGLPVVELVQPQDGEVVAYVDAAQAARLTAGTVLQATPGSGRAVEAVVERVGARVEAVPTRQLRDPTVPEWGVPVTLRVAGAALTPGELVAVDF